MQLVSQGGAHTIVLTVAQDTKGQKDLSMPSVKDVITSTLKNRKEQLLRAAYLTNSAQRRAGRRTCSRRRLIETQGKMPAAPRRQRTGASRTAARPAA